MNYKHSYSINSKTKREKIKIQTLNLKKCTEITERSIDLKTNICKFDECEWWGCERTWLRRCGQTDLKWHRYVQDVELRLQGREGREIRWMFVDLRFLVNKLCSSHVAAVSPDVPKNPQVMVEEPR